MVDPVLHESAGDLVPSEGNGNKGGDIKCSGLGAGTGFTAAAGFVLPLDDNGTIHSTDI